MTRNDEATVTVAVQVGKIEEKLDGTDRKLDAIHKSLKDDVAAVEAQTRKTNGRVTAMEKRLAELRGIGIALVALLPAALFFLQHVLR